MPFQLDVSSLSLAPRHDGASCLHGGKDVLRCWPHEYDSDRDNAMWSSALDWDGTCGQRGGTTLQNCGFEPFTMNYAYDALFHAIPSGTDRRDTNVLLFNADTKQDHLAKRRNFHAALAYITLYPRQYNDELQRTLGVSKGVFVQQVVPTLYSLAQHMSFLDFNLRLWEFNHTEYFTERVTFVPDGFPVVVCQPSNRFVARLLRSGK